MGQNHHSNKCLYEYFISVIMIVYKEKTLTYVFIYASQHFFLNVPVEEKKQMDYKADVCCEDIQIQHQCLNSSRWL